MGHLQANMTEKANYLVEIKGHGLMSRVFANGPGDRGSIPVHTKDSKNGT